MRTRPTKPSEALSDESKWVQRSPAIDINGDPCHPDKGVCWCLLGVMLYCGVSFEKRQQVRAMTVRMGFEGVSDFNDHPNTTFKDVRNLLLRAGL